MPARSVSKNSTLLSRTCSYAGMVRPPFLLLSRPGEDRVNDLHKLFGGACASLSFLVEFRRRLGSDDLLQVLPRPDLAHDAVADRNEHIVIFLQLLGTRKR